MFWHQNSSLVRYRISSLLVILQVTLDCGSAPGPRNPQERYEPAASKPRPKNKPTAPQKRRAGCCECAVAGGCHSQKAATGNTSPAMPPRLYACPCFTGDFGGGHGPAREPGRCWLGVLLLLCVSGGSARAWSCCYGYKTHHQNNVPR